MVAFRHRYRSLLQTRGSGLLDDLDCSWSSGLRKELRYQCGESPFVGREATGSCLLGVSQSQGIGAQWFCGGRESAVDDVMMVTLSINTSGLRQSSPRSAHGS